MKYTIDTEENKIWLKQLRDELFDFGKNFPSKQGGSYYLSDDGTPIVERPRETWITCRMAHVYSIAKLFGFDDADKLVDAAITGICGELHDDKNGGWYAARTSTGDILGDKQCYAHAFVILAATSAKLAGCKKADELLNDALEIYDKYFWNEEQGLAVDTWNEDFSKLSDYRGLNANMHSVEAFLAVHDCIGDKKYLKRAGRIIDRVIGWARDNEWRIPEHYKSDWTPDLECAKETPDDPFKPYGATPGHGIEWARLITQWALAVSKNEDIDEKSYIDAACHLYKRAIEDAWNCDGERGIVYTTDWEGKPVVHDRMHWTLAEAINTSAVLYHVTKDESYASDYADFLRYLDEVVHDKEHGSWYHQLDSHNMLLTTVWPGKSDLYHAVQATIIPYNYEVAISVAKAVYNTK
ncbi:MAG: AGE family epimerase/isomerase [Lachnospiraceae bacterium]|nr:AGE family epimerase/isomerase [Lachnospiraceae bacterium]